MWHGAIMKNTSFAFFILAGLVTLSTVQFSFSGNRIVLEAENAADVQPPFFVIDASTPVNKKAAAGIS